jgi:energy-converting hydrogenase Eha subunit A
MISSSRKLTVISGIVAAVIAMVGVALTLTAPAVSKDGVDSTSTGGPQGQLYRSLGL